MKLKFLKTATDKYSGVVYEVGKVYEFEEKRAKEILAAKGFAVEVEELKVETVENPVENSEKPRKKRTTKTKKDN